MYPKKMKKMIEWFSSFPGMGSKSAERIVIYILELPRNTLLKFIHDLTEMLDHVKTCIKCGNYSEKPICIMCSDDARDRKTICIVEVPKDIALFEKSSRYNGLYHILGGKLSPMEGVGPEDLSLVKLQKRVSEEKIKELIIATGADLEGEATAEYIVELFKDEKNINISRIAFGIPYGVTLDAANSVTLERALHNRVMIDKER